MANKRGDSWNPLLCSYPDSDKINTVSFEAETMFTRLIAKCDDNGNFDGEPALLLCGLYAKRFRDGMVDIAKVERIRDELLAANLIEIYIVNGSKYVHVAKIKKCNRKDITRDVRFPQPLENKELPVSVTDTLRIRNENGTSDKNRIDKIRTTFLSEADEYKLAELLFSLIKKHNPNHKQPDLQKWAKHIDLMIRIDKRSPKEIESAIQWCQADAFWHVNILSTETLRRQYDKLFIKMGARNHGNTRTQNSQTQRRIHRENTEHQYADEGTVINV